jgi:hypothetical protein
MIVNSGKSVLLGSQTGYISGLVWGLFSNNLLISSATVFANIVEAAWTGYSRLTVGTLQAIQIISDKATTQPSVQPTFLNSSTGTQTFYGWFLLDASSNTLIAAQNLGQQSLPAGAAYPLAGVFTDDTA